MNDLIKECNCELIDKWDYEQKLTNSITTYYIFKHYEDFYLMSYNDRSHIYIISDYEPIRQITLDYVFIGDYNHCVKFMEKKFKKRGFIC